jgi:methyltransferase
LRPIVVLALAYCGALRVVELALSKRNSKRLPQARAVVPDGMRGIAAVHALWFVSLAVEEVVVGPTYEMPLFFVVFAIAELVRFWCIATLGDRWNVRVLVLDGAPRIRSGPYRLFKHPNYWAAAAGLVALPLALGLVYTPLLILPLKLLALRRRIRIEDEAL